MLCHKYRIINIYSSFIRLKRRTNEFYCNMIPEAKSFAMNFSIIMILRGTQQHVFDKLRRM